MKKKLLFAINIDWYFLLHWKERVFSELTDGFDVELCLAKSDIDFQCDGCKLSFIGIDRAGLGLWSNLRSFWSSYRILNAAKPDLIHSVTVKPNLFFGVLARVYSKPIILTIPGLGTVFSSASLYYKMLQKIIIFLYRFIGKNKRSYFVFENSSDYKSFIGRGVCYPRNSTVVAGAGVDVNTFVYSPEKEGSNLPIKVLFASRLLRGKGLEDLVEAVRIINQNEKTVSLEVAGIEDSASREALDLSVLRQWEKNGDIQWLGQVKNMPRLIAEVHIVALPTRYGEGLPRILLEAAACGKPIITTDIPGCRDFVENEVTGLVVSPGSIEQLISAIETLKSKEKRECLGIAGRRKVEEAYTSAKVIEHYRKIYEHFDEI